MMDPAQHKRLSSMEGGGGWAGGAGGPFSGMSEASPPTTTTTTTATQEALLTHTHTHIPGHLTRVPENRRRGGVNGERHGEEKHLGHMSPGVQNRNNPSSMLRCYWSAVTADTGTIEVLDQLYYRDRDRGTVWGRGPPPPVHMSSLWASAHRLNLLTAANGRQTIQTWLEACEQEVLTLD